MIEKFPYESHDVCEQETLQILYKFVYTETLNVLVLAVTENKDISVLNEGSTVPLFSFKSNLDLLPCENRSDEYCRACQRGGAQNAS